jgi:hypothetical protein
MLSRSPVKTVNDPNGYTPIECYILLDSVGKGPFPCTDYDTLDRVMKGKENVNLQIKMWIEGILDRTLFVCEVQEYTKDYPEWVFRSFENQLAKHKTFGL